MNIQTEPHVQANIATQAKPNTHTNFIIQEETNSKPDIQRMINEYGNSLLRMCLLYLHDIHLAEDAVQETFIKVYQNWDKIKGNCSEKT